MDPAVVARVLLAAVFAVAGLTKLREREGTERALSEFGLPHGATPALARALPVVELAIAAALLINPLARAGAVAAAILLAVFTVGIASALRRGQAPDCGCFGNLTAKPVSVSTVGRNVVLLALAVFVAVDDSGEGLSVSAALVAAAGALALGIAATRRGRGASIGGLTVSEAAAVTPLELGTPAPDFSLPSTSGEERSLSDLQVGGLPLVMIFLDSSCGSCRELHPHLRRWQRALSGSLRIAVVVHGGRPAAEALAASQGIEDVLVDEATEGLAARFGVAAPPAAVVIGADGAISSHPAPGADAIEALVRQTLHRADEAQRWTQTAPIG